MITPEENALLNRFYDAGRTLAALNEYYEQWSDVIAALSETFPDLAEAFRNMSLERQDDAAEALQRGLDNP